MLTALDTLLIGSWSRAARQGVRLRAGPAEDARIISELARSTALRVVGGTSGWYRIALPDGTTGFVSAPLLEDAVRPVRTERLAGPVDLLDLPRPDAAVVESLVAGTEMTVLASYAGYIFTRTTSGSAGWIARSAR
jgi:SH3-like domain-containing protein